MDKDVILIHSPSNLKFVRDIIKETSISEKTGDIIVKQTVVIKLKNINNGRSRIHPYTEFINLWANKSTSYKMLIANDLVRFLNYIYFDLSSKVLDDISNLTFEIGVIYLNKYAETCCQEVVDKCALRITRFYFFLSEKEMLTYIKKNNFTWVESHKGVSLVSAFQGKTQSSIYQSSENLHHLEFEFILPFIMLALTHEPSIALGIYFQFFGGLRCSEVVSIEYSDISMIGAKGFNGMKIRLSKKDLRPDIKSGFINKTKRPREQVIRSIDNLLPKLFENHKKSFKKEGCNAVFINSRGKVMTSKTYGEKFNKVKKILINQLLQSDNVEMKAYAITLQSYKWSTHIGRGVFSNMNSEVAQNAVEIATVRGDKSLNAAIRYITDTRKIEKKVVKLMESFYIDLEDKFDGD